jgi:Spy/CpxP family protein refolding chaperone
MRSGLEQVFYKLDLSDAQRQQVRSIMDATRAEWHHASLSTPIDLPALANPGDPGHATALESAAARAAQRVRDRDKVQQQLYAILTPAQQARLPQLLKDQQAKIARHRAARLQQAGARSPQ